MPMVSMDDDINKYAFPKFSSDAFMVKMVEQANLASNNDSFQPGSLAKESDIESLISSMSVLQAPQYTTIIAGLLAKKSQDTDSDIGDHTQGKLLLKLPEIGWLLTSPRAKLEERSNPKRVMFNCLDRATITVPALVIPSWDNEGSK